MKNHTFLIFVLMNIFLVSYAKADPISKSVLLSKIMDGSIRWESKLIFFALESSDKSTLDSWASRQKIVYPKFETDLLYYRYTYDEKYEYSFYFNYVQNTCMYSNQTRENVKITRQCWDDIGNCRLKESIMDTKEAIYNCHKKSTNCANIKPQSDGVQIDKKYCEKIYGRSL